MQKLTAMQQKIYDYIANTVRNQGYPPSVREIGEAVGLKSPSTVHFHIKHLEELGYISKSGRKGRALTLTERAAPAAAPAPVQEAEIPSGRVPVLGDVAAGSPILAQEHVTQTYCVESSLFQHKPDYLLKVRGVSMRDAGIMDGDLLAVQATPEARNGQIVVARLNDEVTVKRFRRTAQGVQLLAENPDYPPLLVAHDETFAIEGVAVGLIRNALPL